MSMQPKGSGEILAETVRVARAAFRAGVEGTISQAVGTLRPAQIPLDPAA
jgi:hypothetical protein